MDISRWFASVILRMNFWSAFADLSEWRFELELLEVVSRSLELELLLEPEPDPEVWAKPAAATLRHAAAVPRRRRFFTECWL